VNVQKHEYKHDRFLPQLNNNFAKFIALQNRTEFFFSAFRDIKSQKTRKCDKTNELLAFRRFRQKSAKRLRGVFSIEVFFYTIVDETMNKMVDCNCYR